MLAGQLSRELGGRATEVLVQVFSDCVFVLATQLGKVGSMIQASIPDTIPLPPPSDPRQTMSPSPAAIELAQLFGSAPNEYLQTLYSICTAQIATLVWTCDPTIVPRKKVVVGFAVCSWDRNHEDSLNQEKDICQGVLSMVYDIIHQSN